MIAAWIILFLAHYKSVESMKRVFYLTFPISVMLVIMFTVYALQIGPGTHVGIQEYLNGKPG